MDTQEILKHINGLKGAEEHALIKVFVTPELAKLFLSLNRECNRNICFQRTLYIASSIKSGRYNSSQPIYFDWNGRLADGQHRLTAIIKSDIGVYLNIMVRCDPKARYDIMVAKRTVSNFLQMDYNTTYATAKQATTKWILFYKRIKECSQRTFAISDDDTIEFIVSHDAQLNDMLRIYEALKTRELHQYSTPISAAYYLIKEFNESDDKVMSFFNQIITGANITDGSPVQALRRNLTDKLTRQKVVTNRADAEITFAITITAWNCYFHNKRIKLLKFQDNYDFPTINALPPRRKTGQLDTSCANEDE